MKVFTLFLWKLPSSANEKYVINGDLVGWLTQEIRLHLKVVLSDWGVLSYEKIVPKVPVKHAIGKYSFLR